MVSTGVIVQPLKEVLENNHLTVIVHLPSVYLETYKNRIEAHLLTRMGVGARLPSAQISTVMELGRGAHSFWQTQPQSMCTVRRGAWAGF